MWDINSGTTLITGQRPEAQELLSNVTDLVNGKTGMWTQMWIESNPLEHLTTMYSASFQKDLLSIHCQINKKFVKIHNNFIWHIK